MNSFGRLFRVSIFGESHGESVGIVVDGCSAGMPLTVDDFLPDLERRKGGTQKGTTPRRKKIFRSSKAASLIIKLPGHPLLFYLRIKIFVVVIMKSKEMCQGQAMRIL